MDLTFRDRTLRPETQGSHVLLLHIRSDASEMKYHRLEEPGIRDSDIQIDSLIPPA